MLVEPVGDGARRLCKAVAGRDRCVWQVVVSKGRRWAGEARLSGMSAERHELRELVERLPEEELPAVLADVRRHLNPVRDRPWPPAFFGAGRARRSDVADRSEEILGEGFGRPA